MYRVGIIGTGRIASTIQDEVEYAPLSILLPYSHAGVYASHPATEIVAAADPNAERLAAFGSRWNVSACYADYEDMLAREQLDIVSVCTPTRTHSEVVQAVAKHEVKGIFMEKPLARTLREADAMIAAVSEAGIVAVVNHTRTFDPYYQRVRALIASGAIGTPVDVMVRWREGMSFGGSHLFNLLRFLLDAEVRSVFGRLDAGDGLFDPGGSGVLEFDNGLQAFVNNETGHAVGKELDISGTSGRIRIGDALAPEFYSKDLQSAFGELVQRPFPGSVVAASPMTLAVDELIRAIETGSLPASTLQDGRANLEIAVAFHLSDRTRTPVRLPVTDLDLAVDDPWGRG